jgi:hypothetical protein
MSDIPETWAGPQIGAEEAEGIKAVSRVVNDLRRQMSPSPRLGVTAEHSIEDPFAGQITVSIQLDR